MSATLHGRCTLLSGDCIFGYYTIRGVFRNQQVEPFLDSVTRGHTEKCLDCGDACPTTGSKPYRNPYQNPI
jgi:hypothetical protein